MKRVTLLAFAAVMAWGGDCAVAQSSPQKSADSPEMEYLRRLIAEQQKNPDKILRTVPNTNPPPVVKAAATNRPAPEAVKAASPKAATPVRAREGTNGAPASAEAAQQKKITDVESRIDEMIRQKEAREKATLNNAASATNKPASGPLTKRQRLDDLLRQMIDGKITGNEYNERRAKIIAEPD